MQTGGHVNETTFTRQRTELQDFQGGEVPLPLREGQSEVLLASSIKSSDI